MKLKLLSMLMSLAVIFLVAGCDTADQTTAPDESVMTPDTTAPEATDGAQLISTFTVGLGTPTAASTISQPAVTEVTAIQVCGDGLSGCAYDANTYGGTYSAALNTVDASWTLTNVGTSDLECVYVQFDGLDGSLNVEGYDAAWPGTPQADWCAANNGSVSITGNTGPGNMQRTVPGPMAISGSGTVDVTLGNVADPAGSPSGSGCHYQFSVWNDDAGCGLCGNGDPTDPGETCDYGAPQLDACCDQATCTWITAGLDPLNECDNGLVCDGNEACDGAGGCQDMPDPVCADAVACTDDSCVEPTGCQNVANDANCTDADPCTAEFCDALLDCQSPLVDACDGTWCPGESQECDGGANCLAGCVCDVGFNPDGMGGCTAEICGNGVVVAPEQCDPGAPLNDACCDPVSCQWIAAGLDPANECDNGLVCDGDEACDGSGGCQDMADPVCNDGDLCTVDQCIEPGGCDYGTAVDCSDGLACTQDLCAPATGCDNSQPTDCSDGLACTQDLCAEPGGCDNSQPTDCSDGDLCTQDLCAEPGGCDNSQPTVCDDADPCTTNNCIPATGCDYPCAPINCGDGEICGCAGEICDTAAVPDGCAVGSCEAGCLTCSSPPASFCAGTLDVTLEDGLVDPHLSLGGVGGNSLNANGGVSGQYSAYTAVVNNGPENLAYGFAGSWVDKVRGTLTSSAACDGSETALTIGYTGTSGRTAVDLLALCTIGTSSIPFSVDGPFIDATTHEHKKSGTPAIGTGAAALMPLSTTEDLIVSCDAGSGPVATPISTTIYLANDGLLDETCGAAAGNDCVPNIFIYCDEDAGWCGTYNPLSWRGLSEARLIVDFDESIFSLACHGVATGGCNGLMDLGGGLDYVGSLDTNLSSCYDQSDNANLPAGAASQYVQFGQATTNQWRGLMSAGACPYNLDVAQTPGATALFELVDISAATFPSGSNYAYIVGPFGYPVVSSQDLDFNGGGAPTPVNTAIASSTVTFQ